jgi:hypothetical protein
MSFIMSNINILICYKHNLGFIHVSKIALKPSIIIVNSEIVAVVLILCHNFRRFVQSQTTDFSGAEKFCFKIIFITKTMIIVNSISCYYIIILDIG